MPFNIVFRDTATLHNTTRDTQNITPPAYISNRKSSQTSETCLYYYIAIYSKMKFYSKLMEKIDKR